ncbi:G_PROTEIN_RECEP_F1_2 domain-containing protein [Meloidogyne graminicola]|uniref:G_PROTEIN_RECEP_F1_2 domain-containing protein n=1 Tax=Meloidogyne graminicola TaxID=189291 RepID=A0A8T0A1T1_9BILA|nr:G_PROTEIN_RECEP_F1_2 domain-containing protein [Meloidogyne graminicola]
MNEQTSNVWPECLFQQPPMCREIRINSKVPLDWALPLYGFLMPLVVAITLPTNSFIVIVLSHRSLRTPTNFVLGAMAISELLTGLVCCPWLLYYYTFQGFKTDEQQGLPSFWCWLFPYLATILPSMFHTSAIWLTVYLAIQRFIYICMPKLVQKQCTMHRSKQNVVCISIASIWIYAPELFANYNQSFDVFDTQNNKTRSICVMSQTSLISIVGNNLYHLSLYGLHTILVHTLPCILLVFFTWKLLIAIREADKKHAILIGRTPRQPQRKYSEISPDTSPNIMPFIQKDVRYSFDESGFSFNSSSVPKINSAPRCSISDTKRINGLRQNTRMLLAIIFLFLITEVPAALIFSVHVGAVVFKLTFIHYATLNKLLIIRNVLIVISYPLRFAIYCGMSAQFRDVVQQMLNTKKQKLFLLLTLHSPFWKLNHKNSKTDGKSDSTLTNEKFAVVQDSLSTTTVLLWRERQAKILAKNNNERSTTPMLLEPNKQINNGQLIKENDRRESIEEGENEYKL